MKINQMSARQLTQTVLISLLVLSACGTREFTPPTLPTAISLDAAATANVLTREAPPPGFEQVSFRAIDDRLTNLAGWRYTGLIQFNGFYARTDRPASARAEIEVSYNQVANARRVVTRIDNGLQDEADPVTYEAVRLGDDAFLVRDGSCLQNAGDEAMLAADLGAGSLIGGVNVARPIGRRATINSEAVWAYGIDLAQLRLPNINLAEAQVGDWSGELWISPRHNAVVRFYLTLDVQNARLFGADLPVSGTVLVRYDLFDVGEPPNLSVPFGC